MTPLSQKILAQYQVRKSRAQKDAFIELLRGTFPDLQVEEGGVPHSRNLIIGDPDRAQVVFTAHYDTCAVLPFPNFLTPKNMFVYLLYNLLICVPLFLICTAAMTLMMRWTDNFLLSYLVLWAMIIGFCAMLMVGPANKHTVNDNTSGVITLCEILQAMTPEQRQKAAFVFFDFEEVGLVGSGFFAKRHGKQLSRTLLVNFDCVSDGDTLLLVRRKPAGQLFDAPLRQAFASEGQKVVEHVSSSKAFYPSDQAKFRCGVGVAAFKRHRLLGLYMNRIHTPRDTVMDERNIDLLRRAALRLTDIL